MREQRPSSVATCARPKRPTAVHVLCAPQPRPGPPAGITATLVCFPLDVVRTRLMARGHVGPRYGSGPIAMLAGMLRHEGPRSLYTGCLPAVIGMAPAGAVFYGVYDYLKSKHLAADAAAAAAAAEAGGSSSEGGAQGQGQGHQHAKLSPVYTLLYGALAGAASEIIVYPLEVGAAQIGAACDSALTLQWGGGEGGLVFSAWAKITALMECSAMQLSVGSCLFIR